MKKMIAVLAAGTISLAGAALAQSAMDIAVEKGICTTKPIEATFLANGALKVTCEAGKVASQYGGSVAPNTVLAGTGLGGTGAAALGAVVILAALAGGDDGTTTTTTTTTTTK